MFCKHCCNSSGPLGEDMSFDTFKLLLHKWANKIKGVDSPINIGGGEPTVHPKFWVFLVHTAQYGTPWVGTNGKRTEDALRIAELARHGVIGATLSLDKWHEPIDKKVIRAFKEGLVKKKRQWGDGDEWVSKDPLNDKRIIKTMTTLYKGGRAKEGYLGCCCRYPQVHPNGTITMCGCEDAPMIGTVKAGLYDEFKDIPFYGICHKEYKKNPGIIKRPISCCSSFSLESL